MRNIQVPAMARTHATPVARKRLLSRSLILSTAFKMLEKSNLQSVTMRALSEELNVSPTAIYWHFRSQRDLIQAIVGEVYHRIMKQVVDPSPDWRDRLRTFLRGGFEVLLQCPGVGRFMMVEGRSLPAHYDVQEYGTRILVEAGLSAEKALMQISVMGHTMVSILDWHEQVAEQLPSHSVDTSVYPNYHRGRKVLDQTDPHVRANAAIEMFVASIEQQL
jgi:AcrR family transcriptional regulator